MDLAAWGVTDPGQLSFIDPPPSAAWSEAQALLRSLGALDTEMMLTAKGRRMQELSLPPRLAAMVLAAPAPALEEACLLATVIGEQGLGGTSLDLDDRLQRARRDGGDRAEKARGLARRMAATFVRHPDWGAKADRRLEPVRFFFMPFPIGSPCSGADGAAS